MKLIKVLWTHALAVWKLRCDERHKLDANHVSQQHTHRVHARVRAIYNVIDRLPAVTRLSHFFTPTLESQLEQSTRNLELWLAHTEPLTQHGLAESARTTAAGHKDIRHYFRPLAIPPPPD
jgi:hypothetical protein